MLIFQTKYIICEKGSFIQFHQGGGNMTERFEEVEMYDTKEEAQEIISCWDEEEKDKSEIIPVEITCRL